MMGLLLFLSEEEETDTIASLDDETGADDSVAPVDDETDADEVDDEDDEPSDEDETTTAIIDDQQQDVNNVTDKYDVEDPSNYEVDIDMEGSVLNTVQ